MELKISLIQSEKLSQIACFADASDLSSEANHSLQGHNSCFIELCHKIKCFQVKIELWLSSHKRKKAYLFWVVFDRLQLQCKLSHRNWSALPQTERTSLKTFSRYNKRTLSSGQMSFHILFWWNARNCTRRSYRNDIGIKTEFSSFSEAKFGSVGPSIIQCMQKLFTDFRCPQ